MRLRPGGGVRLRAVMSPLLERAGFENEGIYNGPGQRTLTGIACLPGLLGRGRDRSASCGECRSNRRWSQVQQEARQQRHATGHANSGDGEGEGP